MKLSGRILLLLSSYIGATALVTSVAQWIPPITGENRPAAIESESGEAVFLPYDSTADAVIAPAGEETEPSITLPPKELENPASAEEPLYYLRTAREGDSDRQVIGVYDELGTLIRTLDIPVITLPSADRAALESGIAVSGEQGINRFFEDFGA